MDSLGSTATTSTSRDSSALEELCERHGAHRGHRLKARFVPAGVPFPGSAEESEWLGRKESLVLTVLGRNGGAAVSVSWSAGDRARSLEQRLEGAELTAWARAVEERGGWSLESLARIPVADGTLEFEHESYEYHDPDPDSLDLDGWHPPRRWRIVGRPEGERARTEELLAVYARFVPIELRATSRLGRVFG